MSGTIHETTGPGMGDARADHAGEADPEAIIEAIEGPEQCERDAPTEWRWLPKMDLASFGEKGETCGEDVPCFCSCCAETTTVGDTCRRSTCPRCWEAWCRRAATSAAAKLKATWAVMYKTLDAHPFFHHLVVDIPDDWRLSGDPETVYWRTLDVIKEIMDELGIAGIPIYHPFRGDDETPDDRGEWANRISEETDWDEVSDELEFDPHFHIIGASPFVDCTGVEQVQDETGWVIHRITQEDSNVSLGNDYDMAGALTYCLSHAGIYEDSNGDMSAACHTRVAERPWRKDGWMPGQIPTIREETREEMDGIVRSVSPRVLGTEFSSVACVREVPEDSAADNTVSLAAGSGDEYQGTGDGDGDDQEDDPEPDVEDGDVRLVKCQGKIEHIAKAPKYLSDPDWREEADQALALEKRYEDWKRERGVI